MSHPNRQSSTCDCVFSLKNTLAFLYSLSHSHSLSLSLSLSLSGSLSLSPSDSIMELSLPFTQTSTENMIMATTTVATACSSSGHHLIWDITEPHTHTHSDHTVLCHHKCRGRDKLANYSPGWPGAILPQGTWASSALKYRF